MSTPEQLEMATTRDSETKLSPAIEGQLNRWFRLKAQEAAGVIDPRLEATLDGIRNLVVGVLGSEDAARTAFSILEARASRPVQIEVEPYVQPRNLGRSI